MGEIQVLRVPYPPPQHALLSTYPVPTFAAPLLRLLLLGDHLLLLTVVVPLPVVPLLRVAHSLAGRTIPSVRVGGGQGGPGKVEVHCQIFSEWRLRLRKNQLKVHRQILIG